MNRITLSIQLQHLEAILYREACNRTRPTIAYPAVKILMEKIREESAKEGKAALLTRSEKLALDVDREKIVLDVAGEIFGAIKQHGLADIEDPALLDDWVHEMSLHHHLYQIAHPEVNEEGNPACPPDSTTSDGDEATEVIEAAGEVYGRGLDEFDSALSDVINPNEA